MCVHKCGYACICVLEETIGQPQVSSSDIPPTSFETHLLSLSENLPIRLGCLASLLLAFLVLGLQAHAAMPGVFT